MLCRHLATGFGMNQQCIADIGYRQFILDNPQTDKHAGGTDRPRRLTPVKGPAKAFSLDSRAKSSLSALSRPLATAVFVPYAAPSKFKSRAAKLFATIGIGDRTPGVSNSRKERIIG